MFLNFNYELKVKLNSPYANSLRLLLISTDISTVKYEKKVCHNC